MQEQAPATLSTLLTAAQNNDWETVTKLFSKPIQLTERDVEGKTLIHFAALYGHADFLQQHVALLRAEWVNAKDEQGATPLYLAIRNRHWDCVKLLLNAKADLQAPTSDGLPLIAHWVSSISDPAILEDLLSTQTPVVQRACLLSQSNGIGLLHHAAAAGQTQIVRFLISEGEEKAADAHSLHPLQVDAQNPEGYTPLLKAIMNGHVEVVHVLLQQGAKLEHLNINGDNPIHYAMRCGRVDIADVLTQQLLVRLGFDLRPEAPALQRAFTTLYTYHHRPTAEAFFARAQKEHEANERQQRLADLVAAEEEGEEIKEPDNEVAKQNSAEKERAGMQPIEPLSDEELDKRFQQHQLGQAREQCFALLKNLHPTDPLVSLILLALSESYLQQHAYESGPYLQQRAYEEAMIYASSGLMHYQRIIQKTSFVQRSLQAAALYPKLFAAQQQRIVTMYRQLVLGPCDWLEDLKFTDERAELHQHRERLKDRLKKDGSGPSQTIRTVVKDNTTFFVKLTQRLWEQALTLSQKRLPCRYALLSLGSMSKEEMCPYSDLEFALLLEKDTPEIRACFQPMVRLMHLLVIGLGETPMTQVIPCQIPFSATMTGYHFDKGGNTPLYEGFMATPASLAAIQRDGNYGLTITRNVLRATGFIAGDRSLHDLYQQLLDEVLTENVVLDESWYSWFFSPGRRTIQALEVLKGALPEFSPSSLTDSRYNRGLEKLNIKADLYRFPTQVVDSLSLYYGIPGTTTFEKLINLEKANHISRQTALQLTQLLEIAVKFRVITHLHYGTEEESVGYQKPEQEECLFAEESLRVLNQTEREELLSALQILLSLESAVRTFVDSEGKDNRFKKTLLHSQEELTQQPARQHHLEARSYERLFSPEKALGKYRLALDWDGDNSDIYLHYVSYLHALREMRQRSQATYEETAVSYTKQLVTHLLTLQSQQLLTASGFDPFYEAIPLTWRPAFRANLNATHPIHRHLLERLDRVVDSLSPEELQKVHHSAKASIAAKAKLLLTSQQETADEVKEAAAHPHSRNTTQITAEWNRLSAALKNQTPAAEAHVILLTHSFSLLRQLIHTEIDQVKEYDQEIAKSLTKVTQVLLTPNRAGTRDDAPTLTFYRRLPFEIRPAFRHAVLQYQENMSQSGAQRSAKQHQVDLNFFTTLLKTLNEEPDEAGQRESWQQHKRAWQETLHSLVDDTAAEKNSVCLVSPLLDKSEKQQRTHYPLKSQIREALLDEALEFKANKINGSEHRVVRLKLKQKDGTFKELYCKAYPEMPGMTYLIERLHHRLIGHGTCLSELVKIERPGKPPIPVLISEGIPGPTLHEILKKDPQRLQHLDHQTYSDLVLLGILTNPEDGLPTNYIVTLKDTGKEALTLVSIDHDHALFPPYLLEPVTAKPQEAKHAENDDDGEEPEEAKQSLKPKLQIKTILFCLEGMHKPIDAASREALLRLNPAKVLSSVLREAQIQNDYYGKLFDSQTVKTFHENRANKASFFSREAKNTAENCTIPIPLKEGDAIKLYQKLNRLQQFLTEYPQATLLQCLLHTEPRVGMAYARALDDYCDPLERLLHLGEYPVNRQGQMVTSTQAIKSLRIQTQQIGAEHYADLKDLTPAQGLAELDLMTYQQDTLDSIREEVMRGDLKRFLALKAPEHKAIVISGADQQRKGVDWAQLDEIQQRALLDALSGVAFTHLNLSGCKVLTKKQLTQLLVQSPDCTVLNLSGHPLLDELWLLEIAKNARHLKELTLRQAPCLQHIRNTAVFRHLSTLDIAENSALETVNIRAPQLKLLQAKNCPKLHTLRTASQQLREVDLSGNSALQLAQELAHVGSAYTLNRLKLAGCGQLKASDITLLSVYPALLWAPSKEEVRVKIIALLDQYIGREGWQNFSQEQKQQVSARFGLCEYKLAEVLALALKGLKSEKRFVQVTAQQTLEALAPHVSAAGLQEIVPAVLAGVKDNEWDVRGAAQQTLAALAPHVSAAGLQEIVPAVLAGVKDNEGYVRHAAQQTLAVLAPHVTAAGLEEIVFAALAGMKDNEKDVRLVAQQTLAALAPHVSTAGLQEILPAALAGVKDNEWDVRLAAQQTLAALAPHVSAAGLQEIVPAALAGMTDQERYVRRAAQQTLVALVPHLSAAGLQEILLAVLAGVKDNEGYVRHAAQQTLVVLAPHVSATGLQEIVPAALAGMTDKEEDVRRAAQQTLAALAPHVSTAGLQEIVSAVLAGVTDQKGYVRLAAQQTLAALAPHVSAAGLQEIVPAVLAGVEDPASWSVRKGAQQTLVALVPHLSAAGLQEIIPAVLAGVKDNEGDVRVAAQQTLVALVPHASAAGLQEIVHAALAGVTDQKGYVRLAAQQTLAALAPHASAAGLQEIVSAVLAGVKDNKWDVRLVAWRTLAALAPLSAAGLQEIVPAVLAGVKDQERYVRRAAQQTLVALVPHLSAAGLQKILPAVLAGVKDTAGDVRRAAQQTLAALVPHLSAAGLQEIVSAALAGAKDNAWDVRRAAQKTLAALVPHLSAAGLQEIVPAALAGAKDNAWHVRPAAQKTLAALSPRLSVTQVQNILRSGDDFQQAIQDGLTQYAKKLTLDQLPAYCRWIREGMQNDDKDDEKIRLIMLSGFPILQQRFGTLETYLATLQTERQAATQQTQPPIWLTLGSIYEQLEAQVIDLHVSGKLQTSIKAYENATQTALQTVEDCKAAMEVLVAPELKRHQQQFLETQAALFEQYHATEQQRIVVFQTYLANQAELTSETLAEAQTQFAKEQADAKAVFQAEIQTFYEQAGDQLNGETKLDVSELLQKRRAFLEVQLEQREVQTREQQTLLIQWQQALQDQAHELQEPHEESKAEPSTAPASQKALPQTADQFTQLQQALQMLQAKVDVIDQSNRVLQEQSLADQQALQLQRRQLEVLLRERQQAQQVIEAVAAIQAQPALRNFYHCIKVKLGDCFVACKLFASGALAPPLSTGVSVVTQGISLAGKLLPIPYAALISSGIVEGIQYLAKRDGTQRSKHVSTLVGDLIEMNQLAEKIARLLTWRYELQIQQLTHESAILLAESAVACMMEGLRTKGAIDPQKPLAEQMIQAIYEDHRLVKLPHLFKTKLTTRSGKTDWTASSVLLKCGVALWDKESLTFSFYAQKLHKDPSKKPNHELGSKPEKYGYRLGSLQEVTRLNLRRRADVPADISTAFTSSIGLRFMDVSSKQRVVRMEIPVLLPLSSQSTAAASSTPLEEKEQQPHRPPTPRLSRADASVDQKENDGSGAPTALHKTKKQVRFSDNIHIILPRPRSSQQDDGLRSSPSSQPFS